jgi:membrane-associated protease RseP (regulator of RpoE activity)
MEPFLFFRNLDRGILRPKPVSAVSLPGKRKWRVPLLLFLSTILTTTLAGGMHTDRTSATFFEYFLNGLPFSASLLFILMVHEMGHFIMAKRWGVYVTLPYFIPFPSIIGTMGAVIRMRGRIPSRNALFDIGTGGPLLGFAASILAALYGIRHSSLLEIGPEMHNVIIFGDSLIFRLLTYLVHGPLPAGYDLLIHPVAFAGWLGFFVTSLNLMPMGQLDGGHVLYAMFLGKQVVAARIFFILLFPMILLFKGYTLWIIIGLLIGLKHPPLYDEYAPLSRGRVLLGVAAIAVFIMTFVPVPLEIK